MKRITVKETIYKTVKKGTIDVEAFRASDGKIFRGYGAEQECQRYELKLSFKDVMNSVSRIQTPTLYPLTNVLPDDFYFASNEEQLKAIINHFDLDTGRYYHFYCTERNDNTLAVGDWIGVSYEDGGDSRDRANIYTLNYVKSIFKEYMQGFPNE